MEDNTTGGHTRAAKETRAARERKDGRADKTAVEPRKPAEAKGVRDNDGAARAGQDPPVQAGRQESNNGKVRHHHHGRRRR